MLIVLFLQEVFVLCLYAEGQIWTGDDVPPISSNSDSISTLVQTHTPLHDSVSWLTTIIVDSQSTHMIEHSCGKQTLIGCLVKPLPHFKGHTTFPPFHILMFADDATLREKSQDFVEQ